MAHLWHVYVVILVLYGSLESLFSGEFHSSWFDRNAFIKDTYKITNKVNSEHLKRMSKAKPTFLEK